MEGRDQSGGHAEICLELAGEAPREGYSIRLLVISRGEKPDYILCLCCYYPPDVNRGDNFLR